MQQLNPYRLFPSYKEFMANYKNISRPSRPNRKYNEYLGCDINLKAPDIYDRLEDLLSDDYKNPVAIRVLIDNGKIQPKDSKDCEIKSVCLMGYIASAIHEVKEQIAEFMLNTLWTEDNSNKEKLLEVLDEVVFPDIFEIYKKDLELAGVRIPQQIKGPNRIESELIYTKLHNFNYI